MREREARVAYFKELGAAMVVYLAVLCTSLSMARGISGVVWRTLLLISPMFCVGLGIWAIARHFRRMDEFVRLKSLEVVAISAAVTSGWTFTYGFLENVGFPRLSMFTVWPVMGAVWCVVGCVRALHSR